MLQIENASIAYGNDILFSGFNLQLERGEIASISGPSGCGKSSLLNAILGFTPLKEGRIVLNGILLDKGNVDVVRKVDSTRTGIAAGMGKGHGTIALRFKGKPGYTLF